MNYFVYILETYRKYKRVTYTGYTKNLKKRIELHNLGKGAAIRAGLIKAKNNAIILFDSDFEIDPSSIKDLMILDKSKGISCVIASRFEKINPLSSFWDAGNFFFTKLFNYI